MPKTILHIAEAPGGVERYLVTLLTKMKKYPEYEHILVYSTSFDKDKFRGLVKSIAVIPDMHNAISISHDLKAIIQVRRAIKHYNPDIVYCHSSKAGAIGRVADIGIKNRLIYNAHGWSFNIKGASKKRIKTYEMVERLLAPMTDKIVCISEYEKNSALEHGICKEDKLVVINNGIDFDEFKNLKPKTRSELGISEDAFVVGTIGRLTAQKAPDVFVKMARIVKDKIPNAFFIMVGDDIGDGHFRGETEKEIKRTGLKNSFLITGWVNNPLDYEGLFGVGVLLSRWEGFGLVLPEYMYMGKPIVATRADAIPYVVGDAGILFDIDDYQRAAESVIKLHDDKELRSRVIERGKERVRLFDAQRTADEHIRIVKELVI
ncbi:MAG: glycosyltransferase [Lachnospiraceae bacterium]|nr:glycosyltransferase [Lachnospiraceae bacterium]